MTQSGQDYTITAVQRALWVLKEFQCDSYTDSQELTLMQISDRTKLSPSTVTRILYTLKQEGFLNYDPDTRRYKLSIIFFRLGMSMYNSLSLHRIAKPYIKKLAVDSGLVSILAVMENSEVVVIAREFPNEVNTWPQMAARAGFVLPLHTSGISRLYLSQYSDEKIREILSTRPRPRYTSHTITDIDAIIDIIRKIRMTGVAYCDCENEEYIGSICVPIYGHDRRMIAGLSLGGIRDLIYNPEMMPTFTQKLQEAARRVSHEMGG